MKKLLFALAAFTTLVSCMQEKVETPSLFREVKIMASAAETKTTLDGNSVVWENGDAIALNFTKKTSGSYLETFTTAETGSSATFTGKLSNTVNTTDYNETVYAVYPSTAMAANGTVSFSLPAARESSSGTFPSGQNLSSAVIGLSDFEDGTASATFKNALSIVRFTLDEGVASIKIAASGDLAGSAEMQFDGDGRLEVKAMNAGEKVLTVTPAEGESFDASKVYNLLVYPGTHTSLSVEITDIHGCTFTQEVRGNYEFVPANFYTFNFNTSYVKVYTFSVNSGLTVSAGTELAVVYKDATSVVQSETVVAGSDLKFTVNQIQQVVHGENIKGYAVWPAEAFDNNKINCWMDNTNGGKFGWGTEPTKVAVLGAEKVDFKDPVAAMGKITYTVPVGVTVVKISSDQPISGQREIVVAENGELTLPGTAGAKDVTNPLDEFYVYPISNATLTATLSDGTATVTKQFTGVSIAAGQTKNLDMSGVSFDKNGSFENEDFNDSDIVINFGE